MEIATADVSAAAACRADDITKTVAQRDQWHIGACLQQPRIVKFMAAYLCAGGAKGTVGKQLRLSIAKVHLTFCKTGFMAKKPEHLMTLSAAVFKPLAQDHEATAFTMNRLVGGELLGGGAKMFGSGKRAAVQFRVTAKQPTNITGAVRAFIRQRRERIYFRPCGLPLIQ